MFISRLLKQPETTYWPTELEVAGLCWAVAKVRHMIEASRNPTIVYTDHGAAIQIATQTSMNTTSSVRLNNRHIRSSEYLSRFRLQVRYKPGKLNIVPDALSRLERTPAVIELAYPISIINIHPEFLQRVKEAYQKDFRCVKLIEILQNNKTQGENAVVLPFDISQGILFARPDERHDRKRPVIPKGLTEEFFNYAHDQIGHVGYNRVHERICANFYIFGISKLLKKYLWHCRECRVNATPRHRPFGSLQPISSPPSLFHTISIDFILALPKSIPDKHDSAMSVTDKFSKATTLIPGKTTWSAGQWGNALVKHLLMILWGIPTAIISDRDRKFVSDLWRTMWANLGVRLLFSTAWHPQTDGASERTNQQIEICFRYFVGSLESPERWPEICPNVAAALSNSSSRGTGLPATVLMYGQRIREPIDIAADALINIEGDYLDNEQHLPIRAASEPINYTTSLAFPVEPHRDQNYRPVIIEAIDAIKFAAMYTKHYYDKRHKPIFFKPGQYVSLRLHRGYQVPGLKNRNSKIEQQFAGPFKILERIGRLAYRLELPQSMRRVHPVISVAHLEPAPDPSEDPFDRPFKQHVIHDLTPERLLRKRELRRRGGGVMTEYLVRFTGRTVEYDQWMLDKMLPLRLIEAFEQRSLQIET
ncbi:hypothetical protein K3495_g14176 [Podosphaera aphanis]|nr:hypothetical protein K3495_g14176 [Podosphaera aphanis]